MALLYIIIAIAFIDTFSQLPIISPFSSSLGASPLLIGIIIGMYSFSNIVGNLLSGLWTDRIGPKKILCVGMLTVGIVVFFYSLVDSPYQLAIVRFFHGLTGGLIVPAAFTLLGEKKKAASKGKTMAFSGASVGISAIVGPAFGAIISSRLGYDWLFYTVAFLMVLFAVVAALFINVNPNDGKEEEDYVNPEEKSSFSFSATLGHAYMSILLLLFTLGILTYALPQKVEALQLEAHLTGLLLSVFGIIAILFFLLPSNKLFDQVKKTYLMTSGVLTISTALVLISSSWNLVHLIFAMIVYGIGFALLFPSTSATVMEEVGSSKRGTAFGLFYAFFSLGVILGSFLAGILALPPSQLFFVGAIVTISSGIIWILFSNLLLKKFS